MAAGSQAVSKAGRRGAAAGIAGLDLVARGLGRRFGDEVALSNLSLEVAPGQTFGLLGANGAGKTTFIRIATGYLLPSAGEIRVGGLSPTSQARAVQARLGYVPESPRLYPELRVRGFLRFAAGLRGMRGREAEHAIDAVLDRFQLVDMAQRLIANLSKGYQQRVSLAQGFIHDPGLLIVDEPTSGLDPVQRADVRRVLAELRGQATILLCTHDLAEARELTSQVAVLRRGELVASGPSETLLAGDEALLLFRDPDDGGPPS